MFEKIAVGQETKCEDLTAGNAMQRHKVPCISDLMQVFFLSPRNDCNARRGAIGPERPAAGDAFPNWRETWIQVIMEVQR
jgi:hypothetical protein